MVLEAGFARHRRIPISFRTLIVEIGNPTPAWALPLKTKHQQNIIGL
jgi:hypothetical protein